MAVSSASVLPFFLQTSLYFSVIALKIHSFKIHQTLRYFPHQGVECNSRCSDSILRNRIQQSHGWDFRDYVIKGTATPCSFTIPWIALGKPAAMSRGHSGGSVGRSDWRETESSCPQPWEQATVEPPTGQACRGEAALSQLLD